MLLRKLYYLKYFFFMLVLPAIWMLKKWMGERPEIVFPLSLFALFIGVFSFIVFIFTRYNWRIRKKNNHVPQAAMTPREQRLNNCVEAHLITHKGPVAFMWLNATNICGSNLSVNIDVAEDNQDICSRTIGNYSLFEIHSNVLFHNKEEDTRLWWNFLRACEHCPLQSVILTLDAMQLLNYTEEHLNAAALTLRMRLTELAQYQGRSFSLQVVITGCAGIDGFLLARSHKSVPGLIFSFISVRKTLSKLEQRMADIFSTPDGELFKYIEALSDKRARIQAYAFPTCWGRLAGKIRRYFTLILIADTGQQQCRLQSLWFCAESISVPLPTEIYQTMLQTMNLATKNNRVRKQAHRYFSSAILVGMAGLLIAGATIAYSLIEYHQMEKISGYLVTLEKASNATWNSFLVSNNIAQLNTARQLWNTAEALYIPGKKEMAGDARSFYYQRLNEILLPESRSRLEGALAVAKNDTERSALLGNYLVLRGGASAQKIVQTVLWLTRSWQEDPLVNLDVVQREQLATHLTVLLSDKQFDEALLNPVLISQVRAHLATQPQPRRLLQELLVNTEGGKVSPEENDIDLFFQRSNGQALTPAMNGRYSHQGYKQLQQKMIKILPDLLEADDFIMGNVTESVTPELTASIMHIYYTDYIHYWNALLSGVTFILPETGNGWGTWLKQLAQPGSALFTLLVVVDHQTWLVPEVDGEKRDVHLNWDLVSRHFFTQHQILSQPGFNQSLQDALMATARYMWLAENDAESPPKLKNALAQSIAEAPRTLQPLLEQLLQGSRTGITQLTGNQDSVDAPLPQDEFNEQSRVDTVRARERSVRSN